MRGAITGLMICAVFAETSGSVFKPGTLEVRILPGGEGDVSSSEVARRLRQVQHDGGFTRFGSSQHLPEEELVAKIVRLQNHKHLIELGVVSDPIVLREVLLAAGGNVPRAAIELRKAAQEAHQSDVAASWEEEASCLDSCPTQNKGDAWAHQKTRDCFLQCYAHAAGPQVPLVADEFERDLEIADEFWQARACPGAKHSAAVGDSVKSSFLGACSPMLFNLEGSSWFIGACVVFLVPVVWAIGTITARWSKHPDIVRELERLVALKASAELTDDEFAAAKRALLSTSGSKNPQHVPAISCARGGELSVHTCRRHSVPVRKFKTWPCGAIETATSARTHVLYRLGRNIN